MDKKNRFTTIVSVLGCIALLLPMAGCENELIALIQEDIQNSYAYPELNILLGEDNIITGASVDFGTVTPGSAVEKTFTVTNSGDSTLTLTGDPLITISNTAGSAFSVAIQPTESVAPGESCTFKLSFAPSTVGTYTAEAVMATNDSDESEYSVLLSGTCVEAGTLLTPNGGAAYLPGTSVEITWTAFLGDSVKIDLLKGGSDYDTIIDNTADDGSHTWEIPSGIDGAATYQLRITDPDNPADYDESDAYFAVGTIEVTAPNTGDEAYERGDGTCTIEWTSAIGGNVKIDVYEDGSPAAVISDETENDGTYNWTIPEAQDVGYFTVKITSLLNEEISDESENTFTVRGWVDYGQPFSDMGNSSSMSLSMGPDNRPVVICDGANDDYALGVKKWVSDTTWTDLGIISTGEISEASCAVNSNNIPYVIYTDGLDQSVHVKKYVSGTGSSAVWTEMAQPISSASTSIWITHDKNRSMAIIAITDGDSDNRAHAFSAYWTSTSWTDEGFASDVEVCDIEIAVGSDVLPVILYQNPFDTKGYLEKYKVPPGYTWEEIGTTPSGSHASLAINPSDKPVVVFQDDDESYKSHVMQNVSGTEWTDLGFASSTTAISNCVGVGSDGKPVIAFRDYSINQLPYMRKYISGTGSEAIWADYGCVSSSKGYPLSISIDSTDEMPVLFWYTDSNICRVVKRFY